MTSTYNQGSTQQHPAGVRTLHCGRAHSATGMSLECCSTPSPWLLHLPRGSGLWRELMTLWHSLPPVLCQHHGAGRRVQKCWLSTPCLLSIVTGELLMAQAAGRPAPAVRFWTDHIYRKSEPWKGTKCALVLLLGPHRDQELTCPWNPWLFYSTKRAMGCSVAQRPMHDTAQVCSTRTGAVVRHWFTNTAIVWNPGSIPFCRAPSMASRGCSRTEILSFDVHSFLLAPGQSAPSFTAVTSATKEGIAPRECVSIFVKLSVIPYHCSSPSGCSWSWGSKKAF